MYTGIMSYMYRCIYTITVNGYYQGVYRFYQSQLPERVECNVTIV